MTTQQFWKGFFMTLVGVVITALTNGTVVWAIVGLTLISTVLIYFGKNLIVIWHSTSPVGTLNLANILSAVFILVGQALAEMAITAATLGAVDWLLVAKVSLSVTIAYINVTLLGGPYSPKTVKFIKP
jgi:hypothetical protein